MKTNIFIKTRRQELGLTMKELAAKVGVSEATVSRWESGEITNMRKNALYKLADALKVAPVELMDEVEDRYSIIEFIKGHSDAYPADLYNYDYEELDDLKLAIQLKNQLPKQAESKSPAGYYTDPEVAEYAEELRTNPNMRLLFSAAKNISKKDMEKAVEFVEFLKSQSKRGE